MQIHIVQIQIRSLLINAHTNSADPDQTATDVAV